MMLTELPVLSLLLASNAVLLAAALILIARFQRQCRDLENRCVAPGPAASDARDACGPTGNPVDAELSRRLAELQCAVRDLAERSRPARPERDLPLENAVRMARQGASIEELTRNCGLNIGEARLMQKLHGTVRAAPAAA